MGYIVVDIETTGLSRERHKITEIAAVHVERGKITREFQTLVNPQVKIPRFITKLTGIHDDMVKDAPTIKEALPGFLEFLGEDIFVAHNAGFDYGFLHHNSEKHIGNGLFNTRLCTKKLANRLLPSLPSKRLAALCAYFEIINSQAHRAMADVHATVEVFNRFLSMLEEKGVKDEEQLLVFEKTSPSKIHTLKF